jgi:HSP20 family molecular chaperone IbpA
MERTILLSDVDDKALKAKLDNGILTINIPKKEKAEKALKIEIL